MIGEPLLVVAADRVLEFGNKGDVGSTGSAVAIRGGRTSSSANATLSLCNIP